MDLKWDYILKPEQRDNPVVFSKYINLSKNILIPTDEQLSKIFITKNYILQTWCRAKDRNGKTILTNSPHWIAVRGHTALHIDPRYPRYSHHLKIRVDKNISVRGLNKKELKLERGTFYILDTHSPHQVLAENKISYNVAVSIDSNDILPINQTISKCIDFAITHKITDGIL